MILKTRDEIARMRACGRILARIMREVSASVCPGITTSELDQVAREAMDRHGVRSSFLGYAPWGKKPYPAVLCVSVESQVVHGIPGSRALKDGEIVSLDCGIHFGGLHADMAVTLPVGEVSDAKVRLMETCQSALLAGIMRLRVGCTIGDVARAIQAASFGYGIVTGYGGHGIGAALHEAPFVPNRVDQRFEDMPLREGAALALEPMLNLGEAATREEPDGWTVVTADGSPSAHFEHTVAIVDGRPEVMTIEG